MVTRHLVAGLADSLRVLGAVLAPDHSGFPLMLQAFEGNKGETLTIIPTIRSFITAHELPDGQVFTQPRPP